MHRPISHPTCHLATVSVGSNMGDRLHFVAGSVRWLLCEERNALRRVSSVYEAEPFGFQDQGWFLNCVVQIETFLNLKDFFRLLQEGEAFFERERKVRWGPRTLDLDLLFFDDLVYQDEELTLPHPGVPSRRFVLEPLCEIDPDLFHPAIQLPARTLLERLEDPSRIARVLPSTNFISHLHIQARR